jgi:hypothetical protein
MADIYDLNADEADLKRDEDRSLLAQARRASPVSFLPTQPRSQKKGSLSRAVNALGAIRQIALQIRLIRVQRR